jgi:hypothetical protein
MRLEDVNPCRCRYRWWWCWLDWVLLCKSRKVCDAHDRAMMKVYRVTPP